MPELEETELPGVGVRHDFAAHTGDRVGVVSRRSGRRELIVYDRHDPDAVAASVSLTEEESATLAELLGVNRVARVEDMQQHIEGLAIDWITVGAKSPYAGQTIGSTDLRTKTGVSIVAVLRESTAMPAPAPDFRLHANDTAVVVGTPEGIKEAVQLLGAG